MSYNPNRVTDPARLAVLQKLALLDTPAEEAFDRLTQLASRLTKSPISLVSLIDKDRQFFKSAVGLAEPLASERETPVELSFCQHVVNSNAPLIIEDARLNELVKENPFVTDMGIKAYLGMPITTADGYELGSFCVVDVKPRQWTEDEISLIRELTNITVQTIEMREQLMKLHQQAETSYGNLKSKYDNMRQKVRAELQRLKAEIQHNPNSPDVLRHLEQLEISL